MGYSASFGKGELSVGQSKRLEGLCDRVTNFTSVAVE